MDLQHISIGTTHVVEVEVTPALTAQAMGSGQLSVYATPAMVALMEQAAMLAVQPMLPQGYGTVGVELNVQHTRATPVGTRVQAQATLLEVDGRRLVFEVVASDAQGAIGKGTHVRYIIDNEKFMNKVQGVHS